MLTIPRDLSLQAEGCVFESHNPQVYLGLQIETFEIKGCNRFYFLNLNAPKWIFSQRIGYLLIY